MGTYRYQPLSRLNDEIRLLQLLPGTRASPIRIRLQIEAFELDSYYPEYEAISYAWGDRHDVTTIDVLYGQQRCLLHVTRQCSEALRHVRRRKKQRRLWIDAVCIDQSSKQERARQIPLMAWIFRNAISILAWVGQASATSDVALRYIAKVRSTSEVGELIIGDTSVQEVTESLRSHENDILEDELVSALAEFFHRPWFERLWVWQETYYAQQCWLLCGNFMVPFTQMYPTYRAISFRCVHGQPEYRSLLRRLDVLFPFLWYRMRKGVLWTLAATRSRKCLDPRDRVYVAQGLEGTDSDIDIEPTYENPIAEVYRDAVRSYFSRTYRLDFLAHTGWSSTMDELPTWIPDWSADRGPTSSFYYISHASSRCRRCVQSADKKKLRVLGVMVTKVRAVKAFGTDQDFWPLCDEDIAIMKGSIQRALDHVLGKDYRTHINGDTLNMLCDALCAGHFSDASSPDSIPSLTLTTREHCIAALAQLLDLDHKRSVELTPWEEEAARRTLNAFCRCRSLFQGDDLQLGLAPEATQPGDILVVLPGLDEPIVLRQSHSNACIVVGTAYHGKVMCEEALLGELPENFLPVCILDPRDERWWTVFKCIDSGALQHVDPRLPPLSDSWETESYEEDDIEFLRYKHVKTGEIRGYNSDPRYDNKGLLYDDLPLESFTLI